MSITRAIAHNTMVQAVGRVVSTLIALVIFYLVAHNLGVARYGEFTTATSFLQLFGLAVDLGLYVYLAKRLGEAGVDAPRITSDVVSLRLVSAVVIIGLAPLLVFLFPYPATVRFAVAILALSSIFVTMTQALSGIFQYALRTVRFVMSDILGKVVILLATIVAIRLGTGVVGIALTVTIGSAVTFAATYRSATRIIPIRFRIDWAAWQMILRQTWPIALSIAFNVVYFKADTIILSIYHSSREVGIYGAPYRVLEALISIPAMIAGLLTPILSGAYASDRVRFARILQRGFEFLFFIAVPITVGAQFVADDLMKVIAPEFVESGLVLRILTIATFAIFLGYLFSNAVVVVNKQRVIVWAYGLVALSSLVLYRIFIPRYSYLGAAWVTFFVESAIAVTGAVVVLRTSRMRLSFGVPLRILIAGAVMAAAMFFLRNGPWVVAAVIGVCSYVGFAFVLRIVDRSLLREVFSRDVS